MTYEAVSLQILNARKFGIASSAMWWGQLEQRKLVQGFRFPTPRDRIRPMICKVGGKNNV